MSAGLGMSRVRAAGDWLKAHWKGVVEFAAGASAVVGIIYGVASYVQIKAENERLTNQNSSALTEIDHLGQEVSRLNEQINTLKTDAKLPLPTSPRSGSTVIGQQMTLEWQYPLHGENEQQYTVQLRSIDVPGSIQTLRVTTPQRQMIRMEDTAALNLSGRIVWRVRPGRADDDTQEHLWSHYSELFLYPSSIDRIKNTGVIRIGVAPYSVKRFNDRDKDGNHVGFDIELTKWIADKLAAHVGAQPNIKYVERDWRDLLLSLKRHDVDMVIGSITSTKNRETEYNIRFTDGYLHVNQIFISRRQGENLDSLKGKAVGTSEVSTNEKAANYLAAKYGFTVRAKYRDYIDLYAALDNGEVDYALVDEPLAKYYFESRFFPVGSNLDSELKNFYREHIGRDEEAYAIAVPNEDSGADALLPYFNAFLRSTEGRLKIEELQKTWLSRRRLSK
jgi:ABC-type amino acid transport substrate-binding protein